MSIIIAGMFENIFQAELAADSLRRHHFAHDDVCHFACNPPGAEAGASAGSRSGTRGKLDGDEKKNHPARRRAGVIVAARSDGAADEQTAIQVLQAESAYHIEKAEGRWSGGRWVDFDPVAEPRLVQDRHFNPMASTPGYQFGDKLLVGQSHQAGDVGVTKGGRSAS